MEDCGQGTPPVSGDLTESRRSQATGEGAELACAPLAQERAERLQVLLPGRLEAPRHLAEPQQVHVQVAHRRGEVAEPLEFCREPLELLVRQGQRVPEELDGRAGAPY